MFKKQLLILLIICWSQHSSCFIADLFEIGKKGWEFMLLLNDVKSTKDTAIDFASFFSNREENKEVLGKLDGIDKKLTNFQTNTRASLTHIQALLETLPNEIKIHTVESELASFILSTKAKWTSLVAYGQGAASQNAYRELAQLIINNIGENLPKFRYNLTPLLPIAQQRARFFMLIANHAKNQRDYLCNQGETSHQTLTRLYQIVILTEITAHILLSFAYSVTSSKDDLKVHYNRLNGEFKEQLNRYNREYTKSLTTGKVPYLRACDPVAWKKGKNYNELTGFIQQTIYHRLKCTSNRPPTCQQLAEAEDHTVDGCGIAAINEHTSCKRLYNCQQLYDLATTTDVCVWDQGQYKIRYVQNKGNKLGTDVSNTCPTKNHHVSKFGSFFVPDSFCTCQCRSKKLKFALQPIRSRAYDNYVIVGIRINRVGEYFYIQIAEGKLGANGNIASFDWVPFTVSQADEIIADPAEIKAFFFNDFQLRPGYVLTEVTFAWMHRFNIVGITIRIVGTKFNYQTGELKTSDNDYSVPETTTPKNELTYTSKNPINMRSSQPNHPDSDGYTHILLRQSDLSDDYGQSTLPLFESVPILPNPLSPLGGVGLFHKGFEGYAGFLSLRLYPLNYVHFVDDFLKTHNLDSTFPWNK